VSFSRLTATVALAAGRPVVFILAVALILVWAALGPVFGYSDSWQLVINTGTTIVTFLMVFLLQHAQNRDSAALQLKLDELIRVTADARSRLIGIDRDHDVDLEQLRDKED
jgi:low affinity Fe/Cu permease